MTTQPIRTALFDGYEITVSVRPIRLTAHQGSIVRKAIAEETPQELRYRCLVAEAVNESFGGASKPDEYSDVQVGKRTFRLNPKAKAQFGVNHDSQAYLTVGVIDHSVAEPVRYRLTWLGDAIPHVFKELAVAHDSGVSTPGRRVALSLDTAEVHILGEKNGKKKTDRRRNHDTGPDGKPYPRAPRRHHRRVCDTDL